MKTVILTCVLPLVALAAPLGLAGKASAAEPDKQFFRTVEGKWVGPGEIVAGIFFVSKFTCSFDGWTPDN